MNHLRLKARFADAVWELGRRLGSTRKDRYRFGRMASESYLELARRAESHPIELINAVARSVQIATQLKAGDLIDRGYEFLMQYADSVEQSHIGLWSAPFDRLLPLNGLSAAQRDRILDRHSKRFEATVASGDIFRLTIVGPTLAKYFYDRQQYQRAKDITFAYGEAVLKSAASLRSRRSKADGPSCPQSRESVRDSEGHDQTLLQYQSPEAEVNQLEPIQISYAVQFYRGDKKDDHATVVYFKDDGVTFPVAGVLLLVTRYRKCPVPGDLLFDGSGGMGTQAS